MMVLTKEQENFVKLAQVLVDVLRKHLRKRFIKQWNEKFHATPWNSDSFSGEYLWREIPNEIQNDKKLFPHDVQNKILSGKEDSFGATLLIILLLHAKLNLIETCRRDRKLPLRLSERLDNIRAIRNTFFGNAPNSELSNAEYITVSTELKYEVLHAFGVDAVEEIDVILASEFETQLPVILLDRLNLEIQRNRLLEEKLEGTACLLVIYDLIIIAFLIDFAQAFYNILLLHPFLLTSTNTSVHAHYFVDTREFNE